MNSNAFRTTLIESIIELLDIPPSYYTKARDRYESLGDWMHRDKSRVKELSPDVYPQGSFRYGTVIRPLLKGDEYDLDLVCAVDLSKSQVSQRDVKELIGLEVQDYATANRFKSPAVERKRCWRLDYQDGVSFHMDLLPAVPDDEYHVKSLIGRNVDTELAALSVGITDIRHPAYEQVCSDWYSSNPRGFGRWFERIARPLAEQRLKMLVANRAYASVEEVPPYEWKTPLQRAIQVLKRHRDVMFKNDRGLAPISMIITTLAARSYTGEADVYEALINVLNRIPTFVNSNWPKIPNPVNPKEDFADAWRAKPALETNFWSWHAQAVRDIKSINGTTLERVDQLVENSLSLSLTRDQKNALNALGSNSAPAVITQRKSTQIVSAPEPWKRKN